MSIRDAASESHRAALVALRDLLAETLDDASPNMVPQVAAQFRATLSDIEALGSTDEPKETGLSDFEKRLRERESGAKVPRKAKSS